MILKSQESHYSLVSEFKWLLISFSANFLMNWYFMTTLLLKLCQFLLPETETRALNSDNIFSSKVHSCIPI